MKLPTGSGLLLLVMAAIVTAQVPLEPVAPLVATVLLPAGSLLPLRFTETVSSETHLTGMTFKLEVTDDIFVEHQLVIPAGSTATGEVIHAAKAGRLGKGGELSVSARYLQVGERRIKLRSTLGSKGASRDAVALFLNPFIHGRTMVLPAQTEVVAKTASDEAFPVSSTPAAH